MCNIYNIKHGWIILFAIAFIQCSNSQKISQSVILKSGPVNGVIIEKYVTLSSSEYQRSD